MADSPALALLEFDSVAAGTFAADVLAKEAPLRKIRTGTVQPGKYLILISGETAEVQLAHRAGMRAGASRIIDDVLLPDVHPQVAKAMGGKRRESAFDSLVVLETSTIAAILRAADAAVKGAEVELLELRVGDGLGGKGVAWLTGERRDVEAGLEIAGAALAGRNVTLCHSIVSRIDEAVSEQVLRTTRFEDAKG